MNEFYSASVILSKILQIFSDHLTLPPLPFVWGYLIERDVWCGIYFVYKLKRQNSEGVNGIKKKLNWELLEENIILIVNSNFFLNVMRAFNTIIWLKKYPITEIILYR